ncbi:hypothetical protein EVA_17109 [gut metagenome]|uniref:Uncharacterized protein n=1 Tax=gut metagenome TaxID=749906 RepID=J9FIQ0_9ZZZZ
MERVSHLPDDCETLPRHGHSRHCRLPPAQSWPESKPLQQSYPVLLRGPADPVRTFYQTLHRMYLHNCIPYHP